MQKKITWEPAKEAAQVQIEICHNIQVEEHPNPDLDMEYESGFAMLVARYMEEISERIDSKDQGVSFGQQFFLNKGLKQFGNKGRDAVWKELDQLDTCACFDPLMVS